VAGLLPAVWIDVVPTGSLGRSFGEQDASGTEETKVTSWLTVGSEVSGPAIKDADQHGSLNVPEWADFPFEWGLEGPDQRYKAISRSTTRTTSSGRPVR
jgi:hypothetical protein